MIYWFITAVILIATGYASAARSDYCKQQIDEGACLGFALGCFLAAGLAALAGGLR